MFTFENVQRIAIGAVIFGGLYAYFFLLNQKPVPVVQQSPTIEDKFIRLQGLQKDMRTSVCNLEGSKKSFEEVSLSLSGTTPDLQLSLSPIYEEDAKPRNFFREEFRKFDCNK